MNNRRKVPIDPAYSRYLLRLANMTQKQVADELKITTGAVASFLDGYATSERFWNWFFENVPGASEYSQAS